MTIWPSWSMKTESQILHSLKGFAAGEGMGQQRHPLPREYAPAEALSEGVGDHYKSDGEGRDWSHSDDARRFACFEQATYFAPTRQTHSIIIF